MASKKRNAEGDVLLKRKERIKYLKRKERIKAKIKYLKRKEKIKFLTWYLYTSHPATLTTNYALANPKYLSNPKLIISSQYLATKNLAKFLLYLLFPAPRPNEASEHH